MLYERFGYGGIHTIHAHVVAIVGGPPKCQFAQVARTDHKTAHLSGSVHQYLRAFAGLRVFVCQVVHIDVVSQIHEVLCHRGCNAYLAYGHTELLHQVCGIGIGAVGCAKPWHGDTHYATAVALQTVEGMHCHQQGQCGVEAATNAYHHRLGTGVLYTTCQCLALYADNLLTTLVKLVTLGHKRVGVDGACQCKRHIACIGFEFYIAVALHQFVVKGIGKSRVGATLGAQALHVNFTANELFAHGKTFGLCQQSAIFGYKGTTAEHEVLCAFAITTASIHIASQQAGALAEHKVAQILRLAYEFVACAKIEYDVGTGQCQVVAGRHRCPKVFTYLNTESAVCGGEHEVLAHGHRLTAKTQFHTIGQHLG